MKNVLKLGASIVVCLLAGAIGSFFTTPAIAGWYAGIIKPAFNPPDWIFFPVWTLLFILMGIAAFLIWKKGFTDVRNKVWVALFGAHLALNILWSVFFFGFHRPDLAFLEIIILWLMILFLTWKSYALSKASFYLLLPYLLWVSFAAVLNYAIWQLNKLG